MGAPLGFKTFATGDVLTAADTNGYLMQGVWTFASAAARDAAVTSPQEGNVCYLKDTDAVMTYSGSAWVAVGGASSPASASAQTLTNQTTTSTSYTGLATATAVTLTTGTKAMIMFSAEIELAGTADRAYMSYAVSGATTIAASDAFSINIKTNATQTIDAHSYCYIVTGLTAGSNTFTAQYKSSGATVYFNNRRINVVDMGS
jgi:hypothetical protein